MQPSYMDPLITAHAAIATRRAEDLRQYDELEQRLTRLFHAARGDAASAEAREAYSAACDLEYDLLGDCDIAATLGERMGVADEADE